MCSEKIKNRRIAILLPNLCGGGAERVSLNLAKQFIKGHNHVDFVLMQAHGELLQQVPEAACVVNLGANRIRNAFWPMLRYLRHTRPDALLIGMWPLTVVGTLAHRLSRIQGTVVVSDHSHLSVSPVADSLIKRLVIRLTTRTIYPLANSRLAVSHGVAEDLSQLSGLSCDKFKVIYNPVVDESSMNNDLSKPWERLSGKRILAVGSLKVAKDYPTLIRAFSKVNKNLSSTLVILGEGKLRSELEQLIEFMRLTESVHLPGFVADTKPWYRDSDLFVLSSRWEGLPTVLIEALEAGTPVVSTDCPSGPNEILEDGHYGHLVPVGDAEALAEAILHALQKEPDREALRERAREFSVDKIGKQYLNVLFPKVGEDVE